MVGDPELTLVLTLWSYFSMGGKPTRIATMSPRS
jgi:hypothetical protein